MRRFWALVDREPMWLGWPIMACVLVLSPLVAQVALAQQEDRSCKTDADCAGKMRKDRSYVCRAGLCNLGCKSDDACVRATGNSLAQCVPVKGCKPLPDAPCWRDCVLPAWMGP